MTVGEEIEIVGIHPDREDRHHRPRDVPEDARLRPGGRQRRRAPPRHQARGRRARPGAREARLDHAYAVQGRVYVLSKDEGGRHTPFFDGYRPQFYFRTTDVTGSIKLPEGGRWSCPATTQNMEIELIQPIAMDQEAPLRDPRGRSHGRSRRRDGDPQTGNTVASPRQTHMAQQKIQIRLRATTTSRWTRSRPRSWRPRSARARRSRAHPAPHREKNVYCVIRALSRTRLEGALRGPVAEAADQHPQPDAEDGRLAHAARPSGRVDIEIKL